MKNFQRFLLKNKSSWNKRTKIHVESDFYRLNQFISGETSLNSIEIEALGRIKYKTLLHLQCHFGQDTLSLAREGAIVTGVDFSDKAIEFANNLSKDIDIPARFILHDVLTLDLKEQFDIVFSSYGVLGWLPDLDKWANTVSSHLKVGGLFMLCEFHPFISLLDESQYDYFYKNQPDEYHDHGSYTDGGENIVIESAWWNHSLSDIFESLERAGLKLLDFKEFDYSPYLLDGMVKREEGQYVLKNRQKQLLPYVFILKATKKG